jgi:hypothetical protein
VIKNELRIHILKIKNNDENTDSTMFMLNVISDTSIAATKKYYHVGGVEVL